MVLAQQVCCSYAAGVGNSMSRCERMRGVVVQCIQVETNYSRRGPFERRAGQKGQSHSACGTIRALAY